MSFKHFDKYCIEVLLMFLTKDKSD